MIIDRTKSRVNTVDDRSALAKSAAWAWFQHGSNEPEGQPEFNALRTKLIIQPPKPSRYKLEAIKHEQNYLITPISPTIKLPAPTSSNKPLLDNYEIERISRQLQNYVESSRTARASGAVATGDKVVENHKKKKKIPKRFWQIRHVPACGSSIYDVVSNNRRVEDKGHGASRNNHLRRS